MYKHFGKEIIKEVLKLEDGNPNIELLYDKIYKEFVESLDANDNGISNYPKDVSPKFTDKNITLPSIVSRLNPSWNESCTDADYDRQFLKSSELMGTVFVSLLEGYGKVGYLPNQLLLRHLTIDLKLTNLVKYLYWINSVHGKSICITLKRKQC